MCFLLFLHGGRNNSIWKTRFGLRGMALGMRHIQKSIARESKKSFMQLLALSNLTAGASKISKKLVKY